MYLISTR